MNEKITNLQGILWGVKFASLCVSNLKTENMLNE